MIALNKIATGGLFCLAAATAIAASQFKRLLVHFDDKTKSPASARISNTIAANSIFIAT